MIGGNSVVRCRTRIVRATPLEALDPHGPEGDAAGRRVGLESDEAGVRVAARGPSAGGIVVREGCGLEAVEANRVRLACDGDLVVVPLAGLERAAATVAMIARARAYLDVVERSRPVLVR